MTRVERAPDRGVEGKNTNASRDVKYRRVNGFYVELLIFTCKYEAQN